MAGGLVGGPFKQTDSGVADEDDRNARKFPPLGVDFRNPSRVYLGTHRIHRWTDDGFGWSSFDRTRPLFSTAKITAFGGLGVWAVSNVAKWALSATMLESGAALQPDQSLLGWLAVGLIFAAFAQLIARGVAMRAELDTVI